jgi:hypothetical protein
VRARYCRSNRRSLNESRNQAGKISGPGISTVALDLGSGIPTGCGIFDVKENKRIGRRRHDESHNVYYVN